MKNQKLKATIKLKKTQQPEQVVYREDLFLQKEFTLDEWDKAKFKHPFRAKFRVIKFKVKDFFEAKFWECRHFLNHLMNK